MSRVIGSPEITCLLGSNAVSAMVREGKTFQLPSFIQGGKAQGMQTMDMALEGFVRAGKITPQSGFEKAEDKEAFRKMLKTLEQSPAPANGNAG